MDLTTHSKNIGMIKGIGQNNITTRARRLLIYKYVI